MGPDVIVIIGASAAGISAAREFRAIDTAVPVVLFSEERDMPYYRTFLTEFIRDDSVERRPGFLLNPDSWYDEKNIELRLEEKVKRIDLNARTVHTSTGMDCPFGKLIIASGSEPFVPFPDALSMENVFSIRTLEDARTVIAYAEKASSAIVIGGGLLGLEAAHSFAEKGLGVTVLEMSERILPRHLDAECSGIACEIIEKKNVKLVMGRS
ncbi:MAG: hypothetical protein E4G96_01555, partial [Chrysiogenales bacterium]